MSLARARASVHATNGLLLWLSLFVLTIAVKLGVPTAAPPWEIVLFPLWGAPAFVLVVHVARFVLGLTLTLMALLLLRVFR